MPKPLGEFVIVHELVHLLWPEHPAWWLVLGLPVAGAVVVWVARRFLPGDGGHPPLVGLAGGPTPPRHVPSVVLATLGTLAFGAVLGPEAPILAIGSAVGMFAATASKLGRDQARMITAAGQFSRISTEVMSPSCRAITPVNWCSTPVLPMACTTRPIVSFSMSIQCIWRNAMFRKR